MQETAQVLLLLEALGLGLLIGIERERSTAEGGAPASAGVRTFALASLAGALSELVGGWPLLAVTLATVGGLRAVMHLSQQDGQAGMTTSLALLVVVVLGALSIEYTFLSAVAGVLVAALLAARTVLRDFSRSVLTGFEVRDGLILGVSALVILPILPDFGYGPGGAVNPRHVFIIVVLVMAIGVTSHICARVFGARLGLPLSGLLSGFVSSTATIVAMAKKVRDLPDEVYPAAAGATLSSVSSLVQTGVVLLLMSPPLLTAAAPVLIVSAAVAVLYGAAFMLAGARRGAESQGLELPTRIFSVRGALTFALTVSAVILVSALVNDRFGGQAVLISAALAGLVSTSSAAAALASLVAAGQLPVDDAVVPLAAAISVNTVVRIVLALRGGEARFGRIVALGLLLTGVAVWVGWWSAELFGASMTV
ncbi:MgtC/SapB family protein [Rubellimicrobium roseum]|uniref:MgtC/SapB family protein n=1 Tax=Rubellimicrobium roseum TaxID=687525 RepID=A0A5C4N6D4_9RHOB|nr:DUF4010 domain-containing protein [Rubellimicrobium roseum]TNC60027.1 MgtC/SapB family protein [Rubellimicrobium roseum]